MSLITIDDMTVKGKMRRGGCELMTIGSLKANLSKMLLKGSNSCSDWNHWTSLWSGLKMKKILV